MRNAFARKEEEKAQDERGGARGEKEKEEELWKYFQQPRRKFFTPRCIGENEEAKLRAINE